MTSLCKKRLIKLLASVGFFCGAARLEVNAEAANIADVCEATGGEIHAVLRISQANSIIVDDGREVAMAGIMFPPLPPGVSGAWGPAADAHAALAKLTLGRNVILNLGARQLDRYGRNLAAAHLGEFGGEWVQRSLVEQGHAIVTSRSGGSAVCLRELLAVEQSARHAKRGLWGNAYHQVFAAGRTSDLLRLRSQFTLVTGQIASVTQRAGRLYLGFGDDWKSDFTIVVPKPLLTADAAAAERLSAMIGKWIRVRGWIERRYGPSIEIYSLADIEGIDVSGTTAHPVTPVE